jgi:hypothetical protein
MKKAIGTYISSVVTTLFVLFLLGYLVQLFE